MKIVAIEGLDGAGKTTLRDALSGSHPALEPWQYEATGEMMSPIGDLLGNSLSSMTETEKVLWFAADRATTLERIRPFSGSFVVWDRYVASAYAYRLASTDPLDDARRESLIAFIRQVNQRFPAPSLTLHLDIAPELSVARKADGLGTRFLERVSQEYEVHYRDVGGWVEHLDATLPQAEVVAQAAELIRRFMLQSNQ